MGYLLAFARNMQLTARKTQLNYEQIMIQSQQTQNTNKLAFLEKMAGMMLPKDSPDLQYLQIYKQLLLNMNNSLETRLKSLQTELTQVSAEETNLNNQMADMIAASTPQYR